MRRISSPGMDAVRFGEPPHAPSVATPTTSKGTALMHPGRRRHPTEREQNRCARRGPDCRSVAPGVVLVLVLVLVLVVGAPCARVVVAPRGSNLIRLTGWGRISSCVGRSNTHAT